MRIIPVVDATSRETVVGRHALWLPRLGVKVPFQWGRRIAKYQHDELTYEPAETLPHEIAILRALAAEQMAPPIGRLVYVETLISEHRGAWHADPCGAWGYEMADARSLPPGRFDLAAMRQLPITGSDGAWGDVGKPGNVANGYLVDVRRTAWDMLRWEGGDPGVLPGAPLDVEALRARVHRDCQFPSGERAEAYQDFWLAGELEHGQRRVVERAQALGFCPSPGESVLDIGCQSGGFLQWGHRCGADLLVGVDVDPVYVDCARALARSCRQNISVRQMDVVTERDAFLGWVRAAFPAGVDHLMCLSIEKHVGVASLFSLIDEIGARHVYVETNAVIADKGAGTTPAGPMKLWPEVAARGGRHVGDSRDRNLRRLYRIDRP